MQINGLVSVNKDLCHEGFKTYNKSLFLHVVTHKSLFFYLAFLSQIIMVYKTAGEGEAIPLYPYYHFPPLQRQLNIS